MKQRTRIYYSPAQRSEMWDRWQRGESMSSIGRAFNRESSSVYSVLSPTGGIRPPPRKRSRLALTLSEREEISRGVALQLSLRAIAAQLERSPSTISREINRNGGYYHYRATDAEQATWGRALRPKRCKLAGNKRLTRIIAKQLQLQWAPQQIAGWLKREYPGNEDYHVSHETIYKSLYIQSRGALKKELLQYLRSKRVMRRARKSSLKGQGLGKITNAVSISERPASVEDRAVPGHWEGDLFTCSKNSCIATLVERHTRYVMLDKVKNKDMESVISALIKQSKKLPIELYNSLTWDRASELADNQRFTLSTEIKVYFCDPKDRGKEDLMKTLIAY